ncbi:MAG TPA: CNNM domain-containing protein, partial [Candidatus Sulfotelmatobacter sp.]|nr:CNNM domain-containing protein [Candidatus Sulfotelmatobacter sp.]
MAATPFVALAVVLFSAGASFFFSLAETSLFSLSKWQVRQLSEREPRAGQIVARLLGGPQDLLATMVLGNTFASAAMLSTGLWMALHGRWPLGVTVVGLFVLILLGCEVVPKTLAVRTPERWALRVARPLLLVETVSGPLRKIAQRLNEAFLKAFVPKTFQPQAVLTDADYQELLEMAYQYGTLAQSEKEIILQIIGLDRRTVKEVMKPRSQMAAISDDLSIEDMLAAARKFRHRRLP